MAIGFNALQTNTEGSRNSAIGAGALLRSTGNDNIGVGAGAGTILTTGDKNIYVGNRGADIEDNTIRIGDEKIHTATFVAGINGADEGSPTAVFINTTTGQLGTTPPASSKRFKTEIKPMDQTSEAILALKPVTFQYKSDTNGRPQFGLIAEEVAKVNPALVLHDKQGKPYTVRYDAVNAMLLNEFLKARRQIDAQQKQIDALTGVVQKVSAQLQVNKPSRQVAENN
jgi:Chaperone of endosialidase